ncbi:7-carboxy-7-deazaguanine synthase QueE [Deltaproteobacteria bacterium TL4]
MIAKTSKMMVCQIIPNTLQGEGKYLGEPSSFFRMSLCNLQCSFCDTEYSWKAQYKDQWINYDMSSLIKMIPENSQWMGCVISGGEPMIWQESEDFLDFLAICVRRYRRVTVETNATILPKDSIRKLRVIFSCSPKLSNSGEHIDRRIKKNVLSYMNDNEEAYFKFVVRNKEDVQEILNDYSFLGRHKIWLMPEGKTAEELNQNAITVSRLSIALGFNYTPRIHLTLNLDQE